MTSSLIEQLPARIARLEAKHGPDDPFVKDLKEQLRASKATQGQTAQDVYRAQAVVFEKTEPATSAKLPPEPVRGDYRNDAAFEEARGHWRSHVGRIQQMAKPRPSKASPD